MFYEAGAILFELYVLPCIEAIFITCLLNIKNRLNYIFKIKMHFISII